MSIKRTIVLGEDTKKEKKSGELKTGATVRKKAAVKPIREIHREQRTFKEKGKVLIIVESPAKSKTIEKFLGPNYKVYASMGHLRDLPKSQLGVDIEDHFEPRYANLPGRKKTIDELKHAADGASAIYLATDPDREGEAISWHLSYILNIDSYKDNRITFNEITKHAVQDALTHPRSIDMKMVDAQQARRVLDRLVGYKLSPLLWKKICKGLSAGRVQSVAVRLICEREKEIEAFVPVEYWTIEGDYTLKGQKETLRAELVTKDGEKIEIHTEEEANTIVNALEGKDGQVEKIETRKRSRKAAPPFTTSTMQQEGARKLNFAAKKIMMLAQHLYEGKDIGEFGHVGLITYMRTDSTRINTDIQEEALQYIRETYGDEYAPKKGNQYGRKEGAQDAHEAIRPTSLALTPYVVSPYLSRDELKLYTLIWNRFLASQMTAQQTESVTIHLAVEAFGLRAGASKVLFPGFTKVYEDPEKEKTVVLPTLKEGEVMTNDSVEGLQHFTQPPARYSEAALIKTLEEKGIGRPSTYAPILDTIMARNYVEKIDKQFKPTELGFAVVEFLVEHFDSIINVNFTAALEEKLDEIAEGKLTYVDVLEDFYKTFNRELQEGNDVERIKIADEVSDEVCDKCGSPMVYKFGRYGKFLACSNYPECSNTKPIVVTTGIQCPKCKEHEIVERKSRRGRTFYGCAGYPKCDFSMWHKPTKEFCGTCGSIMEEKAYKNGTAKKQCSNEECETRPKRKPRRKKEESAESK